MTDAPAGTSSAAVHRVTSPRRPAVTDSQRTMTPRRGDGHATTDKWWTSASTGDGANCGRKGPETTWFYESGRVNAYHVTLHVTSYVTDACRASFRRSLFHCFP